MNRILGPSLALGLALASIACESSSTTSTGPSPLKCQVTLEAPGAAFEAGGGQGAVTVSAQPECSWTASADASWLTGLTPSSGQGNGRIEFQATANPAGTMRQGHIAVNDRQIPVQQQAAACRFDVSPAAPSIDAAGGTVVISVTTLAGCRWEARGDAAWAQLAGSGGTGGGSVSIRVLANPGDTRSVALVVAGHNLTLTQASSTTPTVPPAPPPPPGTPAPPGPPAPSGPPPSCTFSIAPNSQSIAAAGGSATVAVSTAAGCEWSSRSRVGWITVASGAGGSGPGVVAFSVAANTGGARSGTLTIAGDTFTVDQEAGRCDYSISPSEQEVGDKGASITVAVSATAGCPWTAASQESWITITQGATGTGGGTVSFTVDPFAKKRDGTVTIAGRTFTVRQDKKHKD